MNPIRFSVCYKCPRRNADCHSTCSDFKAETEQIRELKKAQQKRTFVRDGIIEVRSKVRQQAENSQNYKRSGYRVPCRNK